MIWLKINMIGGEHSLFMPMCLNVSLFVRVEMYQITDLPITTGNVILNYQIEFRFVTASVVPTYLSHGVSIYGLYNIFIISMCIPTYNV